VDKTSERDSRLKEILLGYSLQNPRDAFDVVRRLKGVEGMVTLPGYEAIPMLSEIMDSAGFSLLHLGLECEDEDEAIEILEDAWDRAKLPEGQSPLEAASRYLMEEPVFFETKRLSKKYQYFLGIGYYLQLMRGDHYIALPVEPLAKILKASAMRISSYRGYGETDGYLRKVGRYDRLNQMATQFRFNTEHDGISFPSEEEP
jgi:hypothetical protein